MFFFKLMWPIADRGKPLSEFTYASAIYEWAAKTWIDDIFDTTAGSFGPFQAYATYTTEALKNRQVRDALGSLLDDQNASKAGLSPFSNEEKLKVSHLLTRI